MKKGQYVRCPIVVEEADIKYPRSFVLGKIVEVNNISEEVSISLFDLRNSGQYYAHAFDKTSFPMDKVCHCPAAKNAPVKTPFGMGKIIRRVSDENVFFNYYVLLEDGSIQTISEENMEIEYSAADYSPLEQLKHYEFQNPSWFANRLSVSANLHMINNTIYGFDVLAGCRTFLMAHQISTIVRVFEEQNVRYMLADEVGLGKTIEACSIIKIMSSENKKIRVLYIVPEALATQWDNELRLKFGINAYQNESMCGYVNHFILPLEKLDEYCEAIAYDWDMVLVDETHRLLAIKEKYDLVLNLTSRCKNVLLLSATPIQDRKEEYLKLLSLLQPDQYSRMELETFSSILSKQKNIQRRVNAMLRHMSCYEEYKDDIRDKIYELAEILDDVHLRQIADKIDIDSYDGGYEVSTQALSYVTENYRIERKVIRNRRGYISSQMGQRKLYECSYEMQSEEENYNERNTYYALLQYISYALENEEIDVENAELFLQSMLSSPWALEKALAKYGVSDPELLSNVKLWKAQAEDEIRIINTILDEIPEKIKGRLVRITDYIEQEIGLSKGESGKIVIFSEFFETISKLSEILQIRSIKYAKFCSGMTREELEDNVYNFQNNNECRVILCDGTGGEGRNFQNADWLIFIDLPWNANSIEQRIGRLDRLGRDSEHLEVNSVVFYCENTIEEQLFTIWNEGLQVFNSSLSGLEIITGELNRAIADAIEEDINNGLEDSLEDIIEMMEDARDAVEEEQLYDSGSIIYRPLSQAVNQMLKTYHGGENNLFQTAMLGWATQAGLRNKKTGNPNIIEFGESQFSPRAAIQALLIPPNWKIYENTPIMRREGKILGTFDRGTAIKREDLLFFAPGDPVFESIIGNAVDNGRGRCCAFETNASFSYAGLMFVYNVVPDEEALLCRNTPLRLLAQFRMYLPMEQIRVFIPLTVRSKTVDEKLLNEFVADKQNILHAIHCGSRKNTKSGYSKLESFIMANPEESWKSIVDSAESAAKMKAKKAALEGADLSTAKREIIRIINGFESTCLYLGKEVTGVKEIKRQYIEVFNALSNFHVELDSVCLMRITER